MRHLALVVSRSLRVLSRSSLVLVAPLAFAAPGPEAVGSLEGSVRTAEGRPVPALPVVVTGPAGSRTVLTGPEGRYEANGLAAGEYTVAVPAPGFVLSPEPRATVDGGRTRLDLVLAPAPVREQVVVTATRGEAAASTVGATVSAWDRERIEEREAPVFLQLLHEVPGVATARAGGVGLQSSAFVRGGESRFARILVDGVPVNQPGGAFDFGSALPLELERVEVVRGAASSLYGTDALAGAVQVFTRRAAPGEGVGLGLEAEGGSFDWRRFQGTASGGHDAVDWSAGLVRLTTDNQEPSSAFEETAGAATLGVRLDDRTRARLVVRAEDSTAETPGPTAYLRPDTGETFDRNDVVLGASVRHAGGALAHELRAGWARTDQLTRDAIDDGSAVPAYGDATAPFPRGDGVDLEGFQNRTGRLSAAYQLEAPLGSRHLLTGGLEVERETGALGSRSEELLRPSRTNVGGYLQDRFLLGRRVHLTVGGRVERNGSFGWRAVPRGTLAVLAREGPDATTLRASAGLGIKEPSFFESYGVSFFARGNPDLEPERSRTFDAGIEQRLFGGRARAAVTLFHHDYLDQIAYDVVDFTTFEGTYVNLGRTRARGVEVEAEARPVPGLALVGDYTYLDGEVLESGLVFDPVYEEGHALVRRPKHQGSVTVRGGTGRVRGGVTWIAVGRRADSDFAGLGLDENEGYTRLDARIRVQVTSRLEAFVVGENLLDERYQEVLGYPALGRSVRGGLRLRTGGRP